MYSLKPLVFQFRSAKDGLPVTVTFTDPLEGEPLPKGQKRRHYATGVFKGEEAGYTGPDVSTSDAAEYYERKALSIARSHFGAVEPIQS